MLKKLALLPLLLAPWLGVSAAAPLSKAATGTAAYALATYRGALIDTLGQMVRFNTVADPAVPYEQNPQHLAFKRYLQGEAERLGLDFHDYGYVMVIGLGSGSERVGIITHGDVQPVDPSKWARSPFELDRMSEPGRLLGRGAEDDKGPIATALYAMKSIKDRNVKLGKRLELYVYMAEESDWAPLQAFLKDHTPPQMNITLDSEYPAVTAEKGWGALKIAMPAQPAPAGDGPVLQGFKGGFFGSQIPEDASAVIVHATPALEARIRQRGAAQRGMHYQFAWRDDELTVTARGLSAHSSKPEDGVNAISMLADALQVQPWQGTAPAAMVSFLNELVGTGLYGERFGTIAYRDAFMGPMTVAPTVLKQDGAGLELNINLRRSRGKRKDVLESEIRLAFDGWKAAHLPQATLKAEIGEPWQQDSAPQLDTLLAVFGHYTGMGDAHPVAIGGGTNSRLFPHAVSFGPAMPHTVYTGHSEHEFITEKQLLLNLQMYTAVMVEMAR
ncbi:MAG TPA: dipeptidase [Burkholderiaceae bacterium]|nr:dipeptidase [Burkholderiaceae bacterium]